MTLQKTFTGIAKGVGCNFPHGCFLVQRLHSTPLVIFKNKHT